MSEQTPRTWPVGSPSWADISVTDIGRSMDFYRAVLGWEFEGGSEEFGGYRNAVVDGDVVAGMAPPMEGVEETPHYWTTYLATEDSAATEEKITAAGGTVLMGSMQVGPFGTMGIYADPTGAVFGTWQPASHFGFQRYGEPGAVAWNEAMVADFERGKQFYADVYGWTYEDMSGEGMEYAIATTPGDPAGMTCGIGVDKDNPQPYWSVVFAVDGTDDACERVRSAGGSVMVEPFDFEFGRIAVATGPDGEPFGLITSPEKPPA